MRARSAGVQAWLDYLKVQPAGYCRLCDGVIGPNVTLGNCCICSRAVITAKHLQGVPVKQAPLAGVSREAVLVTGEAVDAALQMELVL